MRAFLLAIAVLLSAISLACGQPEPAESTEAVRPQATSVGLANQEPASNQESGSASERKSTVSNLIPEVEAVFGGKDGEDLSSLLVEAEERVNQQERFEGYRGAWQYMRLLYCQQSKPLAQRALMDEVEALAKQFSQYRPEEFDISRKC